MAFTEFCCRSGGSNLNAGTRLGDSTEPGTAAALTYASGSWVQSTGVFTVASGDPVADGVAVGDFASVYANGSTTTGFVGRVTARTTTTITVSLTAKAGTAPTDGTNDRTLKIGGAWQGPNGADGFPFNFTAAALTNAAGNVPRVNIKNDQTYNITANMTGVTGPHVHQGYTSTYGDGGKATIDGGTSGAAYILFTSNGGNTSVGDIIWKNNGATSTAVLVNNLPLAFRCVFADSRGSGFGGSIAYQCEAYNCNLGNGVAGSGFTGVQCFYCISHDNPGSNTRGYTGGQGCFNCIADTNGQHGFAVGAMVNCDSYNNGGDGAAPSNTNGSILNCNFVKNGGYGINVGVSWRGIISNNGFGAGTQANTSGQINAVAADASVNFNDNITYPVDVTPWVDPADGDFRVNLAQAKGTGRGAFLQTQSGYGDPNATLGFPDIGAAQHQETAGGGGGIRLAGHGGLAA